MLLIEVSSVAATTVKRRAPSRPKAVVQQPSLFARREATDELSLLAERAQSDKNALEKLIAAIRPDLYRKVASWRVDGYSRDDLCADVVLAIIRRLPRYTRRVSFAHWTQRVARWKLNQLKKKSLRLQTVQSYDFVHDGEVYVYAKLEVLKAAWPYMTRGEKRAIAGLAIGASCNEMGELDGVTKQAVHKHVAPAREFLSMIERGEEHDREVVVTDKDYLLDLIIDAIG